MIDNTVLLAKPLLRIDEVVIVLDVAPRSVYRYLKAGTLTAVVGPSGRRLVRTAEIRQFL